MTVGPLTTGLLELVACNTRSRVTGGSTRSRQPALAAVDVVADGPAGTGTLGRSQWTAPSSDRVLQGKHSLCLLHAKTLAGGLVLLGVRTASSPSNPSLVGVRCERVETAGILDPTRTRRDAACSQL